MVSQLRAAETRQKIIDAATTSFAESGFAGTGLNQIIRRADVTPGAFYYHFGSKEDVAFAIIDQVARQVADLRRSFVGDHGAGLANVIEMTFQLCEHLSSDRSYLVAAYLEHTMARHTHRGNQDVVDRLQSFVADVSRALRAGELRDGLTPDDAAETMVTMVYGCLAMTGLMAGDITARLDQCWRLLLPGLVAPDSLAHFETVVETARVGCGPRSGLA